MIPPAILFEDDHLLIVDKPAGLVVHPTYKNPSGTLLDALPPGTRIVTRLDKFTSGIVVVATSPAMHARLQRTLSSPESDKIYLAIVRGITAERGTIDVPLASDPTDRRRRIVSTDGARSVTEYERLATAASPAGDEVSLLRCRLVTGRRHQIRVHLAAHGWPIVGDGVYGQRLEGFDRLALHASRVRFAHPLTGARVDITSPAAGFTYLSDAFRPFLGLKTAISDWRESGSDPDVDDQAPAPHRDRSAHHPHELRRAYSAFAAPRIGKSASADVKLSKNRS
jgi:23S rRNA pseudouridine1911/1915/1917 synthase